jgi:hypothetical protein
VSPHRQPLSYSQGKWQQATIISFYNPLTDIFCTRSSPLTFLK